MQPLSPQDQHNEMKRMAIALALTVAILGLWQYYYKPETLVETKATQTAAAPAPTAAPAEQDMPRAQALTQSARVVVKTPSVQGSIALKGGRLDDVTLVKYHNTIEKDSGNIVLLSPSASTQGYFVEWGWLPTLAGMKTPGANTVWQASSRELTPQNPVTLSWDNGQGLRFENHIEVDENYMFTITQQVINRSGADVTLAPFGRIQRKYTDEGAHNWIMHEGFLGVQADVLNEVTYEDLREDGAQTFASKGGWVGLTDKYWLSAIVPAQGQDNQVRYSHIENQTGDDRYQADYKSAPLSIAAGETVSNKVFVFAGAKELELLDGYGESHHITLFDRAVDFGSLYFLTKPFLLMLTFFNHFFGNFGLAILALTVVIKALMFPLANKSYRSMNQMKTLQPKLEEIKKRCGDDRVKFQQEMMEMYRKEKINPASGCLPLFVQIPVFFALYKVLFVSLEMRHAPFFGWMQDLSAPDTSNIFTAFGMIPWDPPSFMHLGIMPILMAITMILQQKLSPKPNDPTQAKVMALMPYMFLFLFASFPVGLVVYWTWSNTLTILQQWWLLRAHNQGKK